uniref:Uncharacterized protein n=1 Tax=Heterorhabditis bacteriophora TaxID=37862 RepID=A0A1I7W6D4_HETBA
MIASDRLILGPNGLFKIVKKSSMCLSYSRYFNYSSTNIDSLNYILHI